MKTARILVSASSSAMHQRAAGFLRGNTEGVLVIAGSRTGADDVVRRAGPLAGIQRFSLHQFAAALAQAAIVSADLAPLGSLGFDAICTRIACTLARENKLAWFNTVAGSPGFPRSLARTVSDLRLDGISPLALSGEPSLADLSLLLAAYEKELSELSLADLASTLAVAAEAAATDTRYCGLPLLVLDAVPDSAAHCAFLRAVCRRSPDVLALLLENDHAALEAWRKILEVAPERIADGGERALDAARRGLFSEPAAPAGKLDDSISVFSASSEALECVEIARRARDAAGAGLRFDAMAVLLRDPAQYQAPLTEAFRRAGIPLWFTGGASRPDPAGRAFLALLYCAAGNCSASRFAEYLSLGQVPTGAGDADRWQPSGDELLDPSAAPAAEERVSEDSFESVRVPARWERLIVDASVIGGIERWRTRLAGLAEELRIRLRAAGAEDAGARAHIERQLEELGELTDFALPIIELLDRLPERAHWGQWMERLSELAQAALRRPERVLAALTALAPMADAGPAGIEEVTAALSERLLLLHVDPPPRRYGAVFAGRIEDARGASFELVFLPGVVEGRFPRPCFEDPLLLDEVRERLGRDLRRRRDEVANERVLLRSALACAAGRLVLSYPRMDTLQRRPLVPSFYALEIVRAACGRLPNLREFEQNARAGSTLQLGWPAPAEPASSIDDTEFDLAWLRQFTKERPGEKGAARYLCERNEHVVRSMRTRWRRWSRNWQTADGLVAAQPGAFESYRPGARPYSASALQRFAQCPYQFALYSIVGLHPRETSDPLETMDPLIRGSLFHDVQFRFLRGLAARGRLPLTPAGLDSALEDLDAALSEVAAEYADRLAPAVAAVWEQQVEQVRADLRGWLQLLVRDSEWSPVHVEFAFGLPLDPLEAGRRDPASVEQEATVLDVLRLRGSVDSIERKPGQGTLRVTDYKTGNPPSRGPEAIGGGSAMQPLLYAIAVEQILGQQVEASRLWYATERGGYKVFSLFTHGTAREMLRRAIAIIDGHIAGSFLPAAPAEGACDYCDYRGVCGPYEEIRVRRKRQDRLEELMQLRGLP